jgi:hypothetical protein
MHEETRAMLRWSQHVQGLVSGKPSKVVALRHERQISYSRTPKLPSAP